MNDERTFSPRDHRLLITETSPGAPHSAGGLSLGAAPPLPSLKQTSFPTPATWRKALAHREAYDHFARRAAERLPPCDPAQLWDAIIRAITNDETTFIRFVCAANEPKRQVWKFSLKGHEGARYVVWDTGALIPITILTAGFGVRRRNGRKHKRLKKDL